MSIQDKNLLPKYLKKFGRAIDLTHFPATRNWNNVVILPVCGESPDCIQTMFQNLQSSSILIVLVLNRPDQHDKSDIWKVQNTIFKKSLQFKCTSETAITDEHSLLLGNDLPDILLLDFNKRAFDHNDGVGLARRIGSDTAAKLVDLGNIKTPWLFSTDADVLLPKGYFDVVVGKADNAAISLNFKHISDNCELVHYQEKYDFKLKYYQLGVRYIGAAYDYIPLGSSLVVNVVSYAKVRGFPCKSGGEDFYLLNKLAKIGEIAQPNLPTIKIKIRQSDRVPFGTGPAVAMIKDLMMSNKDVLYYHPEIFIRLKHWRQDLLTYFESRQIPKDKNLNEYWNLEVVFANALQNINTENRWVQFIHEWFDAFKILKSVHFFEKFYKGIALPELLQMNEYVELQQALNNNLT